MGELRSQKEPQLIVTFASGVATLPPPSGVPSDAQLTAFKAWKSGARGPQVATCSIDGVGVGTVASALVLGWDVTDSIWRELLLLNAGNTINLTATVGFEERLIDVGIFGALAVAGTVAGTTVTVKFTPLSSSE